MWVRADEQNARPRVERVWALFGLSGWISRKVKYVLFYFFIYCLLRNSNWLTWNTKWQPFVYLGLLLIVTNSADLNFLSIITWGMCISYSTCSISCVFFTSSLNAFSFLSLESKWPIISGLEEISGIKDDLSLLHSSSGKFCLCGFADH